MHRLSAIPTDPTTTMAIEQRQRQQQPPFATNNNNNREEIPTSYEPPPKASPRWRRRRRIRVWAGLAVLLVGLSLVGNLAGWRLFSSKNNHYGSQRAKRIEVEIPANEDSNFVAANVVKIVHVPSRRRIEVHLRGYDGANHNDDNARECKDPLLWGRLSNWALVSLGDFEKHDRNLLVATYDAWEFPYSGAYYLEIIALVCDKRTDQGERFANRSLDLTQQCLYEHGLGEAHHRLTHDMAFIDVDIEVEIEKRHSSTPAPPTFMGRWVHRDLAKAEPLEPPPIHARYQVPKCRYRDDAQRDFCRHNPNQTCRIKEGPACRKSNHEAEVASMDRFYQYTYQWNKNGPYAGLSLHNHHQDKSLPPPPKPPPERPVRVCFVGTSHAREMATFCEGWLERWGFASANNNTAATTATSSSANHINITSISAESTDHLVSCTWIKDFSYPADVTPSKVRDTIGRHGCTHAVVGLFQWYFSAKNIQNTVNLNHWKSRMQTVVSILADPANSGPALRRILLRSLHPNAMGYQHSMCPPMDFRTLPNAHEATSVVREIAHGHANDHNSNDAPRVGFVDTRFLLDPVWDSNKDWSHYTWVAGEAETGFVLWKILREEAEGEEEERG